MYRTCRRHIYLDFSITTSTRLRFILLVDDKRWPAFAAIPYISYIHYHAFYLRTPAPGRHQPHIPSTTSRKHIVSRHALRTGGSGISPLAPGHQSDMQVPRLGARYGAPGHQCPSAHYAGLIESPPPAMYRSLPGVMGEDYARLRGAGAGGGALKHTHMTRFTKNGLEMTPGESNRKPSYESLDGPAPFRDAD